MGRSTADSSNPGQLRTATCRSEKSGRNGSSTAPERRWGLAPSRAAAVVKSSTTSMPMDDPPKRGLTM